MKTKALSEDFSFSEITFLEIFLITLHGCPCTEMLNSRSSPPAETAGSWFYSFGKRGNSSKMTCGLNFSMTATRLRAEMNRRQNVIYSGILFL